MHPFTHALIGWTIANATPIDKRDRTIILVASIIPDIDGLGAVVDLATRNSIKPTHFFDQFHHILGHNFLFALIVTFIGIAFSHKRILIGIMMIISIHLHLLADLIGARGPDGYQWPIPYLSPFSDALEITWNGQWALNAWPNFLITGILLLNLFYLAWKRGYSPLEIISQKADAAFIRTLRERFGSPTRSQ